MDILNISELSEYLKVSKSTIRRLIQKREIPFFRISNKIFFRKNNIDYWINEQKTNFLIGKI